MDDKLNLLFKQDVCRCALECNANLVVVYNGRKTFWYHEQLLELVEKSQGKPFTLVEFFVATETAGEICSNKESKCSFSFVARNVSRDEALAEY